MVQSGKYTIEEAIYELLNSNKNISFRYVESHPAPKLIRTRSEKYNNNSKIISYLKVAPQETIYDIDELNRFMLNLLPELNPSHISKAEINTHPRKIIKVLDDKKTLKTGFLVFKDTYNLKRNPLVFKETYNLEIDEAEILDIDICSIVHIFPDKNIMKQTFLYPRYPTETVEVPWPLKP